MVSALSEHTGLDANQVNLALEVLASHDWARTERNVVWVVDGLMFEPSIQRTNANHRKSVSAYLNGLPKLAIVEAFRRHYARWLRGDEDGIPDPMPIPSPIPSRSLNTEDRILKTETKRLSAPRSASADKEGHDDPNEWPSSWAYDTSQRFLAKGVVIGPKLVGNHAKPVKTLVPWEEWLRVVDRMADGGECSYGLPALLRNLPKYRDGAQPDPNRELTLEEAMAV
jgi:hypothetical protein